MKDKNLSRRAPSKADELLDQLEQAQQYFDRHDYDGCTAQLRSVLHQQADHLGALELMVRCAWRMNQLDAAQSALDRLFRLNPYEPGYLVLQAMVSQSRGDFEAAYRLYARAAAEGDGPHLAQAQAGLAELEAWKMESIKALLETDAAFRVAFLRNAADACRQKGIAWAHGGSAPLGKMLSASLWSTVVRPS
jgi:uncharacterized protein HemY